MHIRTGIHHRGDCVGDEEGDGFDSGSAVYPEQYYHAIGWLLEEDWQPHGHLPSQSKEAPDINEHLRQEDGFVRLPIQVDI